MYETPITRMNTIVILGLLELNRFNMESSTSN